MKSNLNSIENESKIYECWRALGHEYINYLHDISLRLQIGKDPNEIASYIEELSSSLKEVRTLVKEFSLLNTMKVQKILLSLISAGFRIVHMPNVDKRKPKNIDLFCKAVEQLIENSTKILDEDRYLDIEIRSDGLFKLSFPYAEKTTILGIFESIKQIKIQQDEITQAITLII